MASNRQLALRAGTVIEGFEIRKVLGSGGFSVTYQAFDTQLERLVVIKEYCPQGISARHPGDATLHASDTHNENTFNEGLQRFSDEARTLAKFHHPCIVHVLRFLPANGTAYLVMDFEQGQTLLRVVQRRGPLEEPTVRALLLPLLDGLNAVHAQGLLHRDIKPANVLVRDEGLPVLLDFGAARLARGRQSSEPCVMVTPGFSPLEQYSATERQGAWTDLYALGATIYQCMTDEAPIAAPERSALLRSGQADKVNARLHNASGHYSAQLLETVQWMLEPGVADRPRSANQVLRKLQDTEATSGAPDQAASAVANFEASPALRCALQVALQKYAGSLAAKVVPRALSVAADYDGLVNHLAGYILDPQSEIEFRRRARQLSIDANETLSPAREARDDTQASLPTPSLTRTRRVIEKAIELPRNPDKPKD